MSAIAGAQAGGGAPAAARTIDGDATGPAKPVDPTFATAAHKSEDRSMACSNFGRRPELQCAM
jgi:hypothetical protein